jgi:hypothetical protein
MGATYYVSSSYGNDNSPGTKDSPWRTLAKVSTKSFVAGDQILLRRGDEWRETLNLSSSGSFHAPITIGAFGDGADPKIIGSTSRTGSDRWTNTGSGVWFTSASWEPKALFHSGTGATRKVSRQDLKTAWDWTYEPLTHRIFVYLDSNPGLSSIELSSRVGIGWAWASYINVRDLEIEFADFGIAMYGASNWVIEHVTIHDIAVDAIQANGGAKHGSIQDCTIWDWNWHGFRAPAGLDESLMGYGIHILNTNPSVGDGWIIRNNHLSIRRMNSGEDSTAIAIDRGGFASSIADNRIDGNINTEMGGIMFWRPHGYDPAEISGNTIQNVGAMGINVSELGALKYTSEVRIEDNVLHNVCALDMLDQEALRVWTSSNSMIWIRGNLIVNTPPGRYEHPGIKLRQSRATISDNTIWGADIGVKVERSSTDVVSFNNISAGNREAALAVDGTSALLEYHNDWYGNVIGWTTDPTSFSLNPLFVDAPEGNFHLSPSSPAIGRGVPSFPELKDLDGTPRLVSNHDDLGAYVFVSGTP